MVAFTAKYAEGEIDIDKEELVGAGWFSVPELPNIPGGISISRELIDRFVQGERSRFNV